MHRLTVLIRGLGPGGFRFERFGGSFQQLTRNSLTARASLSPWRNVMMCYMFGDKCANDNVQNDRPFKSFCVVILL